MTNSAVDPVTRHSSPVTQQPIGLLGGTFDPIHHGHLRLAEELGEALGLDQVRLMPAGTPPHRGRPAASADRRLAMVRLAIDGNPRFILDEHEIHQTAPCYMVDTLGRLRAELGDARPLILFLGADAFAALTTWHDWRRLFALAHLAVAERPGSASTLPDDLDAEWQARRTDTPGALLETPAGRIYRHAITQLDISASRLRQWIATDRSVRYLLPVAVHEYINQHQLYR